QSPNRPGPPSSPGPGPGPPSSPGPGPGPQPGKKQTSEPQQESGSAQVNEGGRDAELSAEEQLNRQLDWCVEQLELGMKSLKTTPKQKEEASRALKTLRSSKAPLAKKRQVMRAMTGDYRQKMEEEKKKQYKLIQNELASAQVKVASDSPKKKVRRHANKKPEGSLEALSGTFSLGKGRSLF
uniref:Zgc:112185 n=1 Tax=Tetraodon nigroviridis TaxID=99883 RepID=H3C2D1_TETNG